MEVYGRRDDKDTGAIFTDYLKFGRLTYEAFVRTKGEVDPTPWGQLPWPEVQAWCQAARAARGAT